MKLTLNIDINQLLKMKQFSRDSSDYKTASFYLGRFTEKLIVLFQQKGYRSEGTLTSLTKATYLLRKENISAQISQILVKEPLTALLQITAEKEEFLEIRALLESIDIPSTAISYVH
ncbi:hypothetical protein J4437_02115 [Candidatus Woesearchaeota archaeon]|nr:hypothetical protein [Candidatus Woesearchaeota archaeon]